MTYGSAPHVQQHHHQQQQQQPTPPATQQQNINYFTNNHNSHANNNGNNNNNGNLSSHFAGNAMHNTNTNTNNNNNNNNNNVSPTAAKLFVGQLPFECTEERLRHLFSAYGHVEQIHILKDNNNRSRGAAFITFSTVQEADTAIFTLHNRYRMLTNRAIQVSYAKNSLNISPFGTHSALEVHQSNPTNPMPDVATMINNQQMRNF
ncbi:RNA-binding protein [Strigomonas culicis]|uniref:RNA-binding protein n=1 Tax=Strigomonas culicis TaxID=28005 RepID=S9URR1_9TRYP|nr:RNA-binding protein [Strigomonas culicis]|eukprot:EPY17291.1 RNA-binding protein [Strigomonas culicis]